MRIPFENGAYELCWEDGAFLIMVDSRGLKYSNQTGGCACHHPTETGFLLPFPDDWIEKRMCEDDSMWQGDAQEFLDANPRIAERFLADGPSEEAWIRLKLQTNPEQKVVLTYLNSD